MSDDGPLCPDCLQQVRSCRCPRCVNCGGLEDYCKCTDRCPACGATNCECAAHQPSDCEACDDRGCHLCEPLDFDDDSDDLTDKEEQDV